MSFANLLQLVLDFSERAAVIARTIRDDEILFKLLVEEKTGAQKNERFLQDFKTLADVLIQQTLCYEVENQFPLLSGRVHGEESPVFCNAVGETVKVHVQDTEHQTALLLQKVLNGNCRAAEALAHQVHRTDIKSNHTVDPDLPSPIPLEQLAIWIDPIDSTAEYIRGGASSSQSAVSGLCCVTVLIGLFRTTDGSPVAGVINQPFGNWCGEIGTTPRGAVFWGVTNFSNSLQCDSALSCDSPPLERVVVSSSEEQPVLVALEEAGLQHVAASGAGYKALMVVTREVQAYLCSKGSTYMWDTCAPHAVLLSMGGGVVPYSTLPLFAQETPSDHLLHQLCYIEATTTQSMAQDGEGGVCGRGIAPYCNKDGVVAYHSVAHLRALARIVAKVVS